MAGIGFKLNQIMKNRTIAGDILAFSYSAIVSAGPWIITSFTLWLLLSVLQSSNIYFNSAMIYSSVFSSLLTSGILMVETRLISDLIYAKKYTYIFSEVVTLSAVMALISFLAAFFFFTIYSSHPLWLKISSTWLLISFSVLWITSIAAVSAESYERYILGFIAAGFMSMTLSYIFGVNFGPAGNIYGYAIGLNVGSAYMLYMIGEYFGFTLKISFRWIRSLMHYWQNVLIGIFYYLAIWSDDIVTWFSRYGEEHLAGFRFSYVYDAPMFVAYLTTIPTMTMFVLVLETSFYSKYRTFYDGLTSGSTLSEIEMYKYNMVNEMKNNIALVVKFQVLVTAMIFFMNEFQVLPLIPGVSKYIFRIGLIGAMMNGFYLMIMLLLLYFDFRKEVLVVTFFIAGINPFLSNFFLTWVGVKAMGFSFAITFTVGVFLAYNILIKKTENIIKLEYKRQKLDVLQTDVVVMENIKKYVEEQ